jgi:O-antigen ligase
MHPTSDASNMPVAQPAPQPANGSGRVLAWTLFLVPALGVPSQMVLQDTLKSAVLALGVLLAACIFFWQQRHRTAPLLWHGVVVLPLVLMAYALGSMLWSHAYLAGVEAIRWFILSLLLWLGLNTLNRQTLPTVLWGVHAGTVVASLWVTLQFWFDWGFFPQAAFPASTFINRNFYAEYAVSVLPLSAWLLLTTRNSRWLPALAASVGFIALGILMTGTRSALVALLLMAVVLAVVVQRYRNQLAIQLWSPLNRWMVAGALVLVIAGLGSVPSSTPRVVNEGLGTTAMARSFVRTASLAKATEYTEGSFSIRSLMWMSTARMMLGHPWSGVGAGAWEVQIPLYQRTDSVWETDYYAHNEYLQLLSEYGLPVGGLFLAFLLAYLLVSAGNTWLLDSDGGEAPLRALTLGSLLALLLVSNAGFPWHLASTGALFMLCLGILASSDARLAHNDAFFARPLPWSPSSSRLALAQAGGALLLALYITLQAMQAERKIVRAAENAIALREASQANPTAASQPPPQPMRMAQILRDTREGITINPHYRKLTPMVADNLAAIGDWTNAVWIWDSVVASRPNVTALWINLAQGYSRLGQTTQAMHALSQVQRLIPKQAVTRELEIVVLSRTGQIAQAEQRLNTYYDQGNFTFEMVQTGYAMALDAQRWELAIRSLELRSKTWPELAVDGHFRLGLLYGSQGATIHNDAKALAEFKAGLGAVTPAQRAQYRSQVPERYRTQM